MTRLCRWPSNVSLMGSSGIIGDLLCLSTVVHNSFIFCALALALTKRRQDL